MGFHKAHPIQACAKQIIESISKSWNTLQSSIILTLSCVNVCRIESVSQERKDNGGPLKDKWHHLIMVW